MDNREFVVMSKQYAVDDVVEECINALKTPRPQKHSPEPGGAVGQTMAGWMNDQAVVEQRRSKWFNQLTQEDQKLIRAILTDCAEKALGNLFCLIDGVGGSYKGVFEIVAVESVNQRNVLNPQNTEMLHDIFSEVCEDGRP